MDPTVRCTLAQWAGYTVFQEHIPTPKCRLQVCAAPSPVRDEIGSGGAKSRWGHGHDLLGSLRVPDARSRGSSAVSSLRVRSRSRGAISCPPPSHGRRHGPRLRPHDTIPDFPTQIGLPVTSIHGDFRFDHLLHTEAGLTVIDCDEVSRMERLYDLFMLFASPDPQLDGNLTSYGQVHFSEVYLSAVGGTQEEHQLMPTILSLSNEWRMRTIDEWRSRRLQFQDAIGQLVDCSLQDANRQLT